MQNIPINYAQKGMILATEVFQPGSTSTMPVCGKGVVLTESLIERMVRIEIKTICVEGHPVSLPGELSLEEQLALLDRRFRKVNDVPRMIEIKEMFRKCLVRSKEDEVPHG
ncbi:MAG: hypothetical protein HY200_03740 [Nitrospirae bacterium]|nr:hypothetical protein [Nitrospirota bacterium]